MALALRELQPPPSMSERQLVTAVRRGDDRAFEQLFARYRRRISGYIYGLVGDHGRAEELTQDVFISALRRLRETDTAVAFKPWIYEIARNACIDEFRRTRRASVVPLVDEPMENGAPVPRLPDHASPEATWERKQQLGHLAGAFSGLSEHHSRILVMRELEGLSYGEIAERLGVSRPVVESQLFRARRRLSQEYDELASGRRCEDVRSAVDEREGRALGSLGLRQRRRIARHVSHCGDCLRYLRAAGIDEAELGRPARAPQVAALLPLGWLRWLGSRLSPGHRGTGVAAQAGGLGDGSASAVAISRAMAAAVALLVASGTVAGLTGQRHHPTPAGGARTGGPPVAAAFMARPVDVSAYLGVALSQMAASRVGAPAAPRAAARTPAHARPSRARARAPRARDARARRPARSGPAPAGASLVSVLPPAVSAVVASAPQAVVSTGNRVLAPLTATLTQAAGGIVSRAGEVVTGGSSPPALPAPLQSASAAAGAAGSRTGQLSQTAGTMLEKSSAAAAPLTGQATTPAPGGSLSP